MANKDSDNNISDRPIKKIGRPSLYKPEYDEQAYKLCLLGAKDKEIADFFQVDLSTLSLWKNAEPSFIESLKRGKEDADNAIAESLYHRAKGYTTTEDKVVMVQGQPVIVKTQKNYAPDTIAIIFWLKNRQPEKWRDVQKIEHSGNIGNWNDLEREIAADAVKKETEKPVS